MPVLNNLLENREMQLEDGRFLMSADRYDKLLQVRAAKPPQVHRCRGPQVHRSRGPEVCVSPAV